MFEKIKNMVKKKNKDESAEAPVEEVDEVEDEELAEDEEPSEEVEEAKEEVEKAQAKVKAAKESLKDKKAPTEPETKEIPLQDVLESHEARLQKIEYHLRI